MDLYTKLSKKPAIFKKLTGLTNPEFLIIIKKLNPLWDKKYKNKKKVSGRPQGLISTENYLLWSRCKSQKSCIVRVFSKF